MNNEMNTSPPPPHPDPLTTLIDECVYRVSRRFWCYYAGEQLRLRRACTFAQSRQSLSCSHTQSVEINIGQG